MSTPSARFESSSLRPSSPRRESEADAAAFASRCFHCGSLNPEPARWCADVCGATQSFCCAGCLGIARTIHVAGLEAFYDRRTAAIERPGPDGESQDEWSYWDEPAAQAGLVRTTADGNHEVSLLLEGIHCGACIWLIESWLARQSGVAQASVNFATRRARVVWEPGVAQLSGLLRAVVAIGYHAYPYDPARREALVRRESRALLLRLAVALLAMMQVMMFSVPVYLSNDGVEPAHRLLLEWASLTLTLPALVYGGAPFFRGAWRDLALRRAGMDVPVALGLAAAFLGSAWATFHGEGPVYYDSVTMFIALLLCARYIELIARRRAGDAVEGVARARPATAERLLAWPERDDVETVVAVSLAIGDRVLARPGSTVPADGEIVDGCAHVEEAILTGESRPRAVAPGDAILAGSVVRDGVLVLRVSAAGEATRLAAIERLAERAAGERPRMVRLADRIGAWFVAALLVLAAITAIAWWQIDSSRALAVTFAVLVVSCPCALSLATPATLAAAAGAMSQRNVVIVRADALETLSRITHVAFDKTGTLTSGRSTLYTVLPQGAATRIEVLELAAALEAHSEHPLAQAFRNAVPGSPRCPAREVKVFPGSGVDGVIAGRRMRLGRPEFVASLSGRQLPTDAAGIDPAATLVALGDTAGFLALFALGDTPRPGAADLIARLRRLGIVPVLLSGDRAETVALVARSLGITDARGGAQPADKHAAIAGLQEGGAVVAMVGDGINDAPSLAQAQVSVSLGSATPLAQWTADIVVLSDELPRIADAIVHARRTFRIVRENLAWALAYNLVAIPAAAFGYLTPLVAAFGMSMSSLVVVSNSLRAARTRDAGATEGTVARARVPA